MTGEAGDDTSDGQCVDLEQLVALAGTIASLIVRAVTGAL